MLVKASKLLRKFLVVEKYLEKMIIYNFLQAYKKGGNKILIKCMLVKASKLFMRFLILKKDFKKMIIYNFLQAYKKGGGRILECMLVGSYFFIIFLVKKNYLIKEV